jgi:hypothetical protein
VLERIVKDNMRRQRDKLLTDRSYWFALSICSLVVIAFTAAIVKYSSSKSKDSGNSGYKSQVDDSSTMSVAQKTQNTDGQSEPKK